MVDSSQSVEQNKVRTIDQALANADLDFDVDLREIAALDSNGRWRMDPTHKAVVRNDTDEVLSIVGRRYRPVQHRVALQFIDDIVDGFDCEIDSVWGTHNGSKVTASLRYKRTIRIANITEAHPYLLFSTSHDGLEAIKMAITAVQINCMNQLPYLRGRSYELPSIVHSGRVEDKLHTAMEALASADHYLDDLEHTLTGMSKMKISPNECAEIVNRCVDRRVMSANKRNKDIVGILDMLSNSSTMPDRFHGTQMALIQATTEYYRSASTLTAEKTNYNEWRSDENSARISATWRGSRVAQDVFEALAR